MSDFNIGGTIFEGGSAASVMQELNTSLGATSYQRNLRQIGGYNSLYNSSGAFSGNDIYGQSWFNSNDQGQGGQILIDDTSRITISNQASTPAINNGYQMASVTQTSPDKKTWDDTFQPLGWNSQTLMAGASVLGDLGAQLTEKSQYKSLAADYRTQANVLRQDADTNYTVDTLNRSRTRGNQADYMAQQKVSAQGTGFALTSGSIEQVINRTQSQFDKQVEDAEWQAALQWQNTQYQAKVADATADAYARAAKKSNRGIFGTIAGAAIGGYFGGAQGMSIGSKIGGSLGSLF